jgi:hypothetical protein
MPKYKTSQGRSVPHCHVKPHPVDVCEAREWNRAERKKWRKYMAQRFPNSVEVRAPSRKYNCHGYGYARAHAWFEEPELFIDDDFSEVPMDEARRGDVLVYEKSGNIVHTAIVKKATNGAIKKLRSKWGQLAAVIHKPREVHRSYGHPARLLRRNPT